MASENGTWVNTTLEDDFGRPFYLNVTIFIFGGLLSTINTGLLYQMHKRRNAFKAKRFTFLTNLTVCDTLSGLVMIGLSIANVIGADGPLVCFLQGETCLNLCLTMSSYTCSVIIQFIAVRYPLYYKTNITKTKILQVVVFCWLYSIGFSSIKLSYVMAATHHSPNVQTYSVFPYIDLALKISYLGGNCLCFGYVLIIALIRRRQQMAFRDRNRVDEISEGNISERTPIRRMTMANIQQYEAIITSGLRLVLYLITSLPLTVFCAYVMASDDINSMNPGKVYGDSRDVGVSMTLLWFCRAIVDPLITLKREAPRLKRQTTTTSNNDQSIVTCSQSRRTVKENAIGVTESTF